MSNVLRPSRPDLIQKLQLHGAVLPQKSGFKVGDGGSCNFWIKSGLLGLNTFDMSVAKDGRTYQSNALKVTVNS